MERLFLVQNYITIHTQLFGMIPKRR